MKISELITLLQRYQELEEKKAHPEDLECVIPIQGLSGSHSKIKGIAIGFDWHNGQLLFCPENSLNTIDSRLFDFYQKEYLRKNSNFANVCLSKTKVARYKKKEQEFARQWEAENWLWQQLQEDEKQGKIKNEIS